MNGTVKKLTDKGFGFIKTENGDRFFHLSELQGCQYEELREGLAVEFDEAPGKDGKGPRATNVRVLG
jgi:CspA family cold shock protein